MAWVWVIVLGLYNLYDVAVDVVLSEFVWDSVVRRECRLESCCHIIEDILTLLRRKKGSGQCNNQNKNKSSLSYHFYSFNVLEISGHKNL